MSPWQWLGWIIVGAIAITITVPVLAFVGWCVYVYLTPSGREYKAQLDQRDKLDRNLRELDL